MPQSHKRKTQKHHHQDFIPHEKKRSSAVPAAVIFCALIGFGMAYFAAGASILWLATGIIAGGIIGYFVGKAMDRSFDKS